MMMYECPMILNALLSVALIALSVVYIAFIFYSFIIKKYALFSSSIVIAVIVIFLIQVFALTIRGNESAFTTFFNHLPIWLYFLVISIFFVIAALFGGYLVIYNRRHITPNSIIEAFNTSKDGFLYFESDGACILINETMVNIVSDINKEYILNGYDFLNKVKGQTITLENGLTYKFIDKEISIRDRNESKTVTELIALDVTELVNKNRELEEDNNKLKALNTELIEYNKNMLEAIHHEEILKAKINIHNEMNELILESSYLLTNDDKEKKEKILNKWENNALLLFKEAEHHNDDDFIHDLGVLADAIGVKMKCDNYSIISQNDKLVGLFTHACKEALTNVAKHTNSKEMTIELKKENNIVVMSFINKNNKNTKTIKKGGGLVNLEKHVEQLQGKMVIINKEQFILRIEVKDVL
jgi:signal transduction histidine kinase